MDKSEKIGCALGILVVVIALIFGGAIGWCCGWVGGWLLSKIIGTPVATGLNMILGSICNYTFTASDIPLVSATLGFIGGFFKASLSSRSKSSD